MSERLVDWNLAERIASTVAGEGPAWLGAGEAELRRESDRAIEIVSDYTGLRPRTEIRTGVGSTATWTLVSTLIDTEKERRLS